MKYFAVWYDLDKGTTAVGNAEFEQTHEVTFKELMVKWPEEIKKYHGLNTSPVITFFKEVSDEN